MQSQKKYEADNPQDDLTNWAPNPKLFPSQEAYDAAMQRLVIDQEKPAPVRIFTKRERARLARERSIARIRAREEALEKRNEKRRANARPKPKKKRAPGGKTSQFIPDEIELPAVTLVGYDSLDDEQKIEFLCRELAKIEGASLACVRDALASAVMRAKRNIRYAADHLHMGRATLYRILERTVRHRQRGKESA